MNGHMQHEDPVYGVYYIEVEDSSDDDSEDNSVDGAEEEGGRQNYWEYGPGQHPWAGIGPYGCGGPSFEGHQPKEPEEEQEDRGRERGGPPKTAAGGNGKSGSETGGQRTTRSKHRGRKTTGQKHGANSKSGAGRKRGGHKPGGRPVSGVPIEVELKHNASHRHPQTTEHLDKPKENAYYARDLVKALKKNTETLIESRLSRREIQILQGEIPEYTTKEDLADLLDTWFSILDKAFFFNLTGRFMKRPPIRLREYEKSSDGIRSHGCYTEKKITLNMHDYEREGTDDTYVSRRIGTLLHEMLHGWLTVFACECKYCKKKWGAQHGGAGWSGHGLTWCNAMDKLGRALQGLVEWAVDVGIEASVHLEMESSGWRPREEQLERWMGVDVYQIAQHAENLDLEGKTGKGGTPNDWEQQQRVLCCSVM